VTLVLFITAVIIGLMLAEMSLSTQHERALRARGAMAPPGDPYVALAVLYPAAFVAMGLEGAWREYRAASAPAPIVPDNVIQPAWFLSGVVLFVASKALKYWAIRSLGDRWSFRVLIEPGVPLVTTGPYRYVTHPNYVAVVGELVGAAMMDGARVMGPVMTIAFGLALAARVRFENRVLRSLRTES
jgi:methyltransferase